MPLTPPRLNKDGTYYFFEGIKEEETWEEDEKERDV